MTLLQALPLVFVLVGLALYTVLGGADLGAGFWQLAGGRGIREFAHQAMALVWEANHVWLIFVLTVFWTAYPKAFGSVASTLAVPLFLALLGIVFRGIAYAIRAGAETPRELARIDTLFSLSSILVPFALGAAIGGIATNRVPVGNAAGDLWSSWLNATSLVLGGLAVAMSAYLAAIYLAADAAHDGNAALERAFRLRALSSGTFAGTFAIAAVFIVDRENQPLFHSLLDGRALVAVIVSGLAGVATLLLVYLRRYGEARYSAALAVAAVTAGWALARWPTLLPGLTVHEAAAGHDTLVCLVVAVIGGGVIVFPALAFLFRLAVSGRFRAPTVASVARAAPRPGAADLRVVSRLAIACAIAGVGLLNVADAEWAHAAGVIGLLTFVPLAFVSLVVPSLDGRSSNP